MLGVATSRVGGAEEHLGVLRESRPHLHTKSLADLGDRSGEFSDPAAGAADVVEACDSRRRLPALLMYRY